MTKTEIFNRASTDSLITAAVILDAIDKPSQEERLTLAWTIEEIERRHPEATAALDGWLDSLTPEEEANGPSYTEVLIGALR